MNTCSEVGGIEGKARPSVLSRRSWRTVSSESWVMEEERERAGVEAVGECGWVRARASAWLRAER